MATFPIGDPRMLTYLAARGTVTNVNKRGGLEEVWESRFMSVWAPYGNDLWFGWEDTPSRSNVSIYWMLKLWSERNDLTKKFTVSMFQFKIYGLMTSAMTFASQRIVILSCNSLCTKSESCQRVKEVSVRMIEYPSFVRMYSKDIQTIGQLCLP